MTLCSLMYFKKEMHVKPHNLHGVFFVLTAFVVFAVHISESYKTNAGFHIFFCPALNLWFSIFPLFFILLLYMELLMWDPFLEYFW